MARKNKMYEKMYLQLVRECNEIVDSSKTKAVSTPDTLTMDILKGITDRINRAMEILTTKEIPKLPTEFRKIYPKLIDSLLVLERSLAVVERNQDDTEIFNSIENFESAVSEMLVKKAILKVVSESPVSKAVSEIG